MLFFLGGGGGGSCYCHSFIHIWLCIVATFFDASKKHNVCCSNYILVCDSSELAVSHTAPVPKHEFFSRRVTKTWLYQTVFGFDVHVTMRHDKFLIIKPTKCTYFSDLFLEWNSTCFGQFLCPWHHHPDPACMLSANLYDIHHCCVYNEKSWWWTEELSETCRVLFQE